MTSTLPRASRRRGQQSHVRSRWVALAVLACAQLMLVLDVTVVNVALPDIGVALRLQRGELPSSAAGAGLVMAHLGSHDFARAFTVGAVGAAVCLAIAAVLVPAVLRKPAS